MMTSESVLLDPQAVAAIIGVAGALLGGIVAGFFTMKATKIGHDWLSVRGEVSKLCEQVRGYHKLEELYKLEVEKLSSPPRTAKTIMEDMRAKVEAEGFSRPTMTQRDAEKIKSKWA